MSITSEDLTRPGLVVQIGLPPFRLDILTSASGITFAEAWPDRVERPLGDIVVPFIGRAALIRNKRASGRHKDLADLESLGEE